MRKLFSPLFLSLFVLVPQVAAIGYVHFSFGLAYLKGFLLKILLMLLSGIGLSVYAYTKRKEEVLPTKIFLLISFIYTLFIIWGAVYALESFSPKGFVSPKLVFIASYMLSVLYGIVGTAYNTTTPGAAHEAVKYVLGLIAIPFLWFIGINLIGGMNSNMFMITFIVVCSYAILFFIVKLFFIWKRNEEPITTEAKPSRKYSIALFVIAFCFPLAGLVLNQSFADMGNDGFSAGLFGDFSHPFFFIIAAINGLLLLIPPAKTKELRLALFYLKSIGYSYILYFFIVFLPIMPLGFIGLIFYGLGVLILTPAMVTLLQGYHLLKEWKTLSQWWNKKRLAAVFSLGMITLPLSMGTAFMGDKGNFSAATQYLQYQETPANESVNLTKLKRTLKNLKGSLQVTRGEFGFSSGNTPILSSIYSHLVLDNKIISHDSVLRLENLFFDAGHNLGESNLSDPSIVDNRVRLLSASSETRFDEQNSVYKSWIHLKLENYTDTGNGEYKTEFKLPEGAYISDYYLDVLGTRKEGLLTDRRAALFIYRKIVNTRRDPGLLHYIGKNILELRVFPFGPKEIRETGFEIMHREPFTLTLDHQSIALNGAAEQKEIQVAGAVLLSAAQKNLLQAAVRAPKYYFVIDSSKNSNVAWHIRQIQDYVKANGITDAKVIFASYKLQEQPLSNIKNAVYRAEGGFNLNMAVHRILDKNDIDTFPIIIAVSDNMPKAVFPQNTELLSGKFPESAYYYGLNHNLTLTPYSFTDNRPQGTVAKPTVEPILDYHGVYVSDNGKSELVLTDMDKRSFASTGNLYQDALLLDAMSRRASSSGERNSLELVRASFRTRILTPQTAFIVVETQEQEKELLEVQERLLNNPDATPTITLDEPSLRVCMVLILAVVLIIHRKKLKV